MKIVLMLLISILKSHSSAPFKQVRLEDNLIIVFVGPRMPTVITIYDPFTGARATLYRKPVDPPGVD